MTVNKKVKLLFGKKEKKAKWVESLVFVVYMKVWHVVLRFIEIIIVALRSRRCLKITNSVDSTMIGGRRVSRGRRDEHKYWNIASTGSDSSRRYVNEIKYWNDYDKWFISCFFFRFCCFLASASALAVNLIQSQFFDWIIGWKWNTEKKRTRIDETSTMSKSRVKIRAGSRQWQ